MKRCFLIILIFISMAPGASAQLDTLRPKWVVDGYFFFSNLSPDENTVLASKLGPQRGLDTLFFFNSDNGSVAKFLLYDLSKGLAFFSPDSRSIIFKGANCIIKQNIQTGLKDTSLITGLTGLPADYLLFPTKDPDVYTITYFVSFIQRRIIKFSVSQKRVLEEFNIKGGTIVDKIWYSPDFSYIAFTQGEREGTNKGYDRSYIIATDSLKVLNISEKDNPINYINFSTDSQYGIYTFRSGHTFIANMNNLSIVNEYKYGLGFISNNNSQFNWYGYIDSSNKEFRYRVINFSTNSVLRDFYPLNSPDGTNAVYISDSKNSFYFLSLIDLECYSQPTLGMGIVRPRDGGGINVIPNPAENNIALEFLMESPEAVSIDIIDNSGKTIKSILNIQAAEGKNRINISSEGIVQGNYIVRLRGTQSKTHFTTKLMLTK